MPADSRSQEGQVEVRNDNYDNDAFDQAIRMLRQEGDVPQDSSIAYTRATAFYLAADALETWAARRG